MKTFAKMLLNILVVTGCFYTAAQAQVPPGPVNPPSGSCWDSPAGPIYSCEQCKENLYDALSDCMDCCLGEHYDACFYHQCKPHADELGQLCRNLCPDI